MRPLQYDSSRAKDNSITQAAAAARNHDAAITMCFAAPRHKPACMIMYVRTWQQNTTTIMQPFHCDQQPQIPKHPITMHTHKRIQSSLKPPLHCGKTKKNIRTIPARTRVTHELPCIVGCTHFTRKAQSFALRLPPQNKPHATFMQPFVLLCDVLLCHVL